MVRKPPTKAKRRLPRPRRDSSAPDSTPDLAAPSESFIKQTFEAKFTGYFTQWEDDDFVYLSLSYAPDQNFGEPPRRTVRLPRSLFESEEQIGEWITKTWNKFVDWWSRAIYDETNQHFWDTANYYLDEMGLSSYTFDDMVKGRSKAGADNLKLRFGRPVGRGRHSKWSKVELEAAIKGIIKRKPALSWAAIRDEIAVMFPEKAPKSGEALRVLAHGWGLSLREIKKRRVKK
jgi:hypothetical protein